MNYLLKIASFTAFVLIFSWFIVNIIFDQEFGGYYLIALAYFLSATVVFHYYLLKYLNSGKRFVTAYMAGTGLKMLITLGIIVAYFFYSKFRNNEVNVFLVMSIACYHLLFLAFESVVLFGMTRSSE